GPVELVDRCVTPLRDIGVHGAVGRLLGERLADAVAQLGSGLLGEGDGRDLAELGCAGEDELEDPVDQGRRLSRPGTGLHEEGVVQVVAYAIPLVLVGRDLIGGDAHAGPPRIGSGSGSGSSSGSRTPASSRYGS